MSFDELLSSDFLWAWVKTKRYGSFGNKNDIWNDLYAYCGGGPLDGIRF